MPPATADGVLPELQRELDEFMATYATMLSAVASDTSVRVAIASNERLDRPLSRLQWITTTLASTRLCETTQFMLSWLTAVEGAGSRRDGSGVGVAKCASWVVAFLVSEILEARVRATSTATADRTLHRARHHESMTVVATEKMVELVLDRCVVVFQETFQSDAARAVESGGGFFGLKPVLSHLRAPTLEETLQESVAAAWRRVAALVSLCSLSPMRMRLQRQLLTLLLQGKNPNGKDYLLLKNLSEMRLGLDETVFLWPSTVPHKARDAALLLKVLHPLVLKPYKPPTRLAAITAIASLLNRELDALDVAGLQRLYASFHGVAEWTSIVSELHGATLKLCTKREFAVAAWELRVALLSVSPNEIFTRYWKEDAHALLRVQYQHNKDGGGAGPQASAVLECVGRCFTHMLKRHFLTDRRIPGDLDCMEIINSTQAWCFFAYPKHRSIEKLMAHVLPVLVEISLGIASYNMQYSIHSHLRRLVLEADHIFDEKKLVGLEALLAVCAASLTRDSDGDVSRPLERKVLLANRSTLGELVGQTLIEANALFGGDLLIESTTAQAAGSAVGVRTANLAASAANKLLRDEYRRAIALHSYACALRSLKYLYAALELSDDQKILILVRSSIHNQATVRESASTALHNVLLGVSRQAGVVFRGVTDYIFRLSNHLTTPRDFDAFLVLINLTTSLLRSVLDPPRCERSAAIVMPWESRKAKQESLLQIESVAVYLLVFEDARLLEAAVTALEVVAQARAVSFGRRDDASTFEAATVERPSVVDVLRKAEWGLRELLFSFEPSDVVDTLAVSDLGFFRQLIAELAGNTRASFRWSSCLGVVYAQLAIWNPEVAAFMWADVSDKVTKLEPAMPSILESESTNSGGFDLARWRNLAILATTTACPYLMFQPSRFEDEDQQSTTASEVGDAAKDCSVQSVISSSAVQTLFKRLCRFLKSPSMDQKKAAILALGCTHLSSLPILIEVLHKYAPEAFASVDLSPPSSSRHGSLADIPAVAVGLPLPVNGNGIGPRRFTKEQKARNLKATAQLQLQWALGRCYRLLLHTTQQRPLLFDDTTREAVARLQASATSVIEKIAAALSKLQPQLHGRSAAPGRGGLDPRDAPQHIVFMMQQDVCSSIRALAYLTQVGASPYSSIRKRQMTTSSTASSNSVRSSKRYDSYRREDDDDRSPAFEVKHREAWYTLLLSWCQSFSSLANARLSANLDGTFFAVGSPARDHWMQRCDVLGERVDDTLLPWQWVDEGDATRALGIQEAAMASFQRFFLCQTAFATLPVLVRGPVFLPMPISPDAAVFRWLDECFAVDVGRGGSGEATAGPRNDDDRVVAAHHFAVLQHFCHAVLGTFLASEFRAFVDVCVDKSFFSVASGDKHNVAKHYFQALGEVASKLQHVLQHDDAASTPATTVRTVNLQVRVCHTILMHLGIESGATQRQHAVDLMNALFGGDDCGPDDHDEKAYRFQLNATVSSGKRSNATYGAQVTNRMQVAGASFLVQKLTTLAYPMSMSMLKFLSCCEPMQQKKTLVVVLPWLAEVNLAGSARHLSLAERPSERALPRASALEMDQLLSLLFRITTNLGASCSDQLEQAWLTLAFAEPSRKEEPLHENQETPVDTNLSKVLQFLFLQRTTSVRLATAKLVVWWLSRWQSAAHEVLREALLLVETRRRESAHAESLRVGTETVAVSGAAIQPVDDVFVFVILLSDSCCHLATIPTYLYQHPAVRAAMMVQAVHFAFLALYALALDPRTFVVRRTVASRSGSVVDDHQQQSLYVDAGNDCLVLLRNLLSQLNGPIELMAPIIEDLASWASRSWEEQLPVLIDDKRGGDRAAMPPRKHEKSTRHLERAMAAFASCLPPSLRNAWALECVKEITLALVPGSTLLQQISSRCNNTQVLYCVRFGLLGYRVLAPEFHGDVFLTLLDLLHHALDEHARDPSHAGEVLGDTLAALRAMVASMPPQKLVLYPQILWVCVALLNHGKSDTLSFHAHIVDLLLEVLRIPHFATNQLLQDVVSSKKPPQWSDDQASVLRTLVWSLDRSSVKTQRRILPVVASFLVLPSPVFHANSIEHLMISTMALMPFIVACSMHPTTQDEDAKLLSPDKDDDEDNDDEYASSILRHSRGLADALQQATDLQFAWLALGSEPLGEAFVAAQNALSVTPGSPEDEDDGAARSRSVVEHFAAAFVAELVALGGDDAGSLVTMCFEILVKILAAEDRKTREMKRHVDDALRQTDTSDSQEAVVTATLWLVEALMGELGTHKLVWRPTSALLGSLARLVRSPSQTQTWQAAVRIMSCLGASNRTVSASNAVRVAPQLTISTAVVPAAVPPEGTTVSPASRSSNAHVTRDDSSSASGASTPGKKESNTPSGAARKFLNLMGHRSSSSSSTSSNSPSHNQNQTSHAQTDGRPTTRLSTVAASSTATGAVANRKKSSFASDPSQASPPRESETRREL